ncbi:hypothetical protein ACFL7M_17140 [Thermodesulfobacteriota bacterium]
MKIHLDFKGVPILYKTLRNEKEMKFEFSGEILRELIDSLIKKYGLTLKKALLDNQGNVDMEIRVILNKEIYLTGDRMCTSLHDGDTLAFKGAS